jgi:hypothetical protein
MEKTDFIAVYDNVFDAEFCDSLIKNFDEVEKLGLAYRRAYTTADIMNDAAVFASSNLEHFEKHARIFSDNFWSSGCFEHYKKSYMPGDACADLSIFNLKLQKTTPSEGYHIWHCENGDRLTQQRVAAFTVYLNDDFEAGETEFLYQQRRLKPKKGSVCIFPAAYTHLHRGNPPIGGTKYIITGWLEY